MWYGEDCFLPENSVLDNIFWKKFSIYFLKNSFFVCLTKS